MAMALELEPRQRAMLAEMGVRLWAPRPAAPAALLARPVAVDVPKPPPTPTPSAVVAAPAPAPAASTPARARAPAAAPAPVHPEPPAGVALTPLPEGIDTMDWPALQAAVATCRACGLCAGRTQAVFGTGSRAADWMVVGEAPGETEDRVGEPFVGPAGQLLDNMLAAVGLSRRADVAPELEAASADPASASGPKHQKSGVYIANVIKCRPPGNRNPEPFEVAQCEHYLRRQVALVQPKIILALGRFAVQALLGSSEPIGRLRGRVHHYQGVPVIVSYHPAYLLRALPDKAKAWQDLCLALATLEAAPAP